jgi:hypothetical protein
MVILVDMVWFLFGTNVERTIVLNNKTKHKNSKPYFYNEQFTHSPSN